VGGYAHKQGHVFGGVCHKNVTLRIGIGAQVGDRTGSGMCGKGHMITEDQIVIAGAGIDVVTCHMIVTVVTVSPS
jgi:hypothetical protein